MLPESLLCVDSTSDGARPRWLAPRDEVWVRGLLDALDGTVGLTVDEAEKRLDALALRGAPPRAAAGVRMTLARLWKTAVVAAAPPPAVRRAVFDQAARPGATRSEAIAAACAMLGITPADAMAALYADRPGARRIVTPERVPSPREALDLYHLALVQGLLFRSEVLVVHVREHVRAVVRFAKLRGLLCTYRTCAEGTAIDLSGPLSLFRHTTKYGHALATFFPAVAATPGWSIEARVVLRDRRLCIRAGAGDPVASGHALPRDADSAVERRFARELRRLGSAWTVERETAAVHVGGAMFFPDFTLRRGDDVVYVEIVGYYTVEYLRSKLETLRRAGMRNLVVCIDEDLACEDEDICAGQVVRYRRRVDVARVVEAAEVVARDRGDPGRARPA